MHQTRNIKDTVFTTLFNNERRLIELYNALEDKNLSYDTHVKIKTLNDYSTFINEIREKI